MGLSDTLGVTDRRRFHQVSEEVGGDFVWSRMNKHQYILSMLKEDDSMHNGHYYAEGTWEATRWSAFLAGALIGAGIALLLAPQPGIELRARLRNSANCAKDDVLHMGHEAWETAVERGKEYYDKGAEVLRDVGRSAREFAEQGQKAVKDIGSSAKESAKHTRDMAHELERSASVSEPR